jgi:ABC-type branched-subunit amino acid transport system ATPase component
MSAESLTIVPLPSLAPCALRIEHLNVRLGSAHVLQDVSVSLPAGVLSLVGRNGMGKTTLCRAIVGLVASQGNISSFGHSLQGRDAASIARMSVGYVPQGRRLWPSLTVEEHLRLVEGGTAHGWTRERLYERFPKLHERRRSEASRLSGGEQQMLAIARALLRSPALMVMDEPTEGLAPVVVDQVELLIRELVAEGMSVFLVEQNLGVAVDVADSVAVLTNGRISTPVPAAPLRTDVAAQRALLGFAH